MCEYKWARAVDDDTPEDLELLSDQEAVHGKADGQYAYKYVLSYIVSFISSIWWTINGSVLTYCKVRRIANLLDPMFFHSFASATASIC